MHPHCSPRCPSRIPRWPGLLRCLSRNAVRWLSGMLCAACVASRATGGSAALEPRFVAVHNTLSAMGLAQIGPIQQGALAEGREANVLFALPAGCVTIVAMGADGVRDLDATLLDARQTPLAHDTTTEPQAVLRPCLDEADTYVLRLRAAAGSGGWVAAAWVGGADGPTSTAVRGGTSASREAKGTCALPIPLSPGVVTGVVTPGDHQNAASCGPSDSREQVYELNVTQRSRVSIEVEAAFDTMVYVRKDDCTDEGAEIDCNDDGPDRTHSRIERVLEPGKYFIFVDGYGHETGSFKMTVSQTGVLALADVCRHAPLLPIGTVQPGTLSLADDARATCGGGAAGPDAPWRVELASRARVRIVEHSEDVAPVLHVRHSCRDPLSELACSESGAGPGDACVTGVLQAGSYSVFADSHEPGAGGRYTLSMQTVPVDGIGVTSDACGDAAPLPGTTSGKIEGDTFGARDDLSGSCGGAGAPDVVYRLDVARTSRWVASLDAEEAPHLLVAWRRCADRSTELACGRGLREVVGPGTYFVAVDGASSDAFGRFTLSWSLQDLAPQSGSCSHARLLTAGGAISGSTAGAGDKFAMSCGAGDSLGASGPDRVFRIVLRQAAAVRLTLTAMTFDAVLALRAACTDQPGGSPPELACETEADSHHRIELRRSLQAGTYWVVVDGQSPSDEGAFTLDYAIERP